jgi:hypothetical protein
MDGDGRADRVDTVRAPDAFRTQVWLRRGDGAGGFGPAEVLAPSVGSPRVVLADIDADGALDVLTTESGGVAVRLGTGDGRVGPLAVYGSSYPADLVATGDMDGDGYLDAVVAGVSGAVETLRPVVYVRRGDAEGRLGPLGPVTPVGQAGDRERVGGMAIADVDGDGALDVVGANDSTNGDLWALLGDGHGGLGAPTIVPTAAGTDVDLADVDGDTHLDAVVVRPRSSGGEVLHGDGAGGFGDAHTLGGGAGATRAGSVVAARLDAGPTVDVAFGRGRDGAPGTAVLLNPLAGRRH